MRKMNRGFTLVEVLVALMVLGVALSALLRMLGQSIDGAARLSERTAAQWVAEDVIASHRVLGELPPLGERGGTRDMGRRSWDWTESIRDAAGLRRIDVAVRAHEDVAATLGRRDAVESAHLVAFWRVQ